MVLNISYFILFEIIIFARGNPAYKQGGSDHKELQDGLKKLVEDIMKKGNYDVMVNHHEDQPGRHHEDITHITYNGEKPNSRYNYEKYRSAEYPHQGGNGKNTQYNNRPSYTNTQNYNLFLRKRPSNVENNTHLEETKYKPQIRSESDNKDDVLEFLNDLDKTLKIKGNKNLDLRCSGNRCGESRYESDNSDREEFFTPDKDFNINPVNDNYNRHLRCNGRSCSLDLDDDRNDRDSLRCYGNRCSRKANDRDDDDDDNDRYNDDNIDFSNILRCAGDSCGLNRDDDDDDDKVGIDSLRCVGDRCGLINRDDDDDDDDDDNDGDRVGKDSLHCVGNTCSFNRNDDDDDTDDTNSYRCVGDRCGRNRKDYENYKEYRDNNAFWDILIPDRTDNLRCVGDRCGWRGRNDDDDQDSNHKYEDEDETEDIVNTYLSRAFDTALRAKVSPSEKRRFMQEVKKLMSALNIKLKNAIRGTGRYPRNQVNL